jgi:hypothetical protein
MDGNDVAKVLADAKELNALAKPKGYEVLYDYQTSGEEIPWSPSTKPLHKGSVLRWHVRPSGDPDGLRLFAESEDVETFLNGLPDVA